MVYFGWYKTRYNWGWGTIINLKIFMKTINAQAVTSVEKAISYGI